MAYRRVLIKLSGEALGLDGKLFDFSQIDRVAGVLAQLAREGMEIGVVIGAGNIWRGRQGPAARMDAVTADHMGMLGTMINCLAMRDALVRAGQAAKVFSAVAMHRFADEYTQREAKAALSEGTVALFACGIGSPFFSTDTAVALRAVELGADAILLAKNVDGVYDSDPNTDPDATFIPDISYQEAQRRDLKVMDAAALAVCRENSVPVLCVFGLKEPENILRAARGERLGTLVHP